MGKKEKSSSGKFLSIALCLAAALGGMWFCLLHAALSQKERAPRAETPMQQTASIPELAKAEPVILPEPEEPAAPTESQNESALRSPSTSTFPPRPATPPTSKPRRAAPQDTNRKSTDLSAYKVKALSAKGEDYLPRDTSLSAKDLNAQQKKSSNEKGFDGGKGVLGDIYRGGKRLLDSMDAATLDATRRVLGNVARPEEAKLRPSGGGVRLKIEIPPESVNIGR